MGKSIQFGWAVFTVLVALSIIIIYAIASKPLAVSTASNLPEEEAIIGSFLDNCNHGDGIAIIHQGIALTSESGLEAVTFFNGMIRSTRAYKINSTYTVIIQIGDVYHFIYPVKPGQIFTYGTFSRQGCNNVQAVKTASLVPTAIPTSTPLPTSTSVPVALPTAQPPQVDIYNDPTGQAYIAGITEALDLFINGSGVIGARFGQAVNNLPVMLTDEWKNSVVIALASLQMSSEAIRALEPPVYFADIHYDMLIVADRVDNAIPLLTEGIDNLDADKLRAGSAEYLLAVDSMNSSKAKLEVLVVALEATYIPAPAIPLATTVTEATATSQPLPMATHMLAPTATMAPQPAAIPSTQLSGGCDSSYPDVCIPSYPPDLNCPELSYINIRVIGDDPHRLDADHDGIGCEE